MPIGIQTVIVFNNQIRIGDIFALKSNVQIIAHTYSHDVFWGKIGCHISELVINIVDCLNAGCATSRLDAELINNFRIFRTIFYFRQSDDDLLGHNKFLK